MMILITIFQFLISIMNFIEYLLIFYIILGWFVFFGAIKNRDGFFFRLYVFLMTKIEPLLGVIRRFIPSIAGFDFSPLVVFFGLHLAKILVIRIFSIIFHAIYG